MIKLYHKIRKKSTLYAVLMHCVDFFSALIYKGSEGFTYNNTIKKVKLYKKIKEKIIIENIVFVVCCLHWLHLIAWGWLADAQWAPLR